MSRPDALDAACDSIGCLLPDVQLQPMVANYVTHPPKLERFERDHARDVHRFEHRQLPRRRRLAPFFAI